MSKKKLIQQQAITIEHQRRAMAAQTLVIGKAQDLITAYDRAVWAMGEQAHSEITAIIRPHLAAAQIATGHLANVSREGQAAIAAAGATA